MPAYRDKRDGRWRYRKWVALPNGTRTRITGTPPTDTKVAAEAAERAHIDRVLHPERARATPEAVPQRKETPTLEEFADRFMREYLPRQKPTERKSKEYVLSGSIVPFFGAMRLDEIDQTDINAFIGAQTVATKTLNNRLAVLGTLLRYAGPTGCKLIPETLLRFHVDGGMAAEIIAVPIADVGKLLAAATDARYRVAVLLASEAGLRIGEIRGLQWTDIKSSGRLTVRRAVDPRNNVGTPKHDKSRSVRLSPALDAALAALPRRGLWVITTLEGGMIGYWTMLEAVQRLYDRAGVAVPVSETGATMPWHSLRHTFGTELAARGVPIPTIKELMGHADVKTTMRYVTVTAEQMDDAICRTFGQQVGNGSAAPTQATEI
jgi:integrase